MNNTNYSKRSRQAMEVIDSELDPFERWNVPFFVFFFLSFFSILWFLSYPDIIEKEGNVVERGYTIDNSCVSQSAGEFFFTSQKTINNNFDSVCYIKIDLNPVDFKKMECGMNVNVFFEGVSSRAADVVQAKLIFICMNPSKQNSYGLISFANEHKTIDNKVFSYQSGMRAHVYLIGKNVRFLKRIYSSFFDRSVQPG